MPDRGCLSTFLSRLGVCLFLPLAMAACGGGGGGGGVPVTVLGRLQSNLSGAEERTVVNPTATAFAVVELQSDGTLTFGFTGQNTWIGGVNGLHIHRGAAGANGGIEVNLLGGGATFTAGTATTGDTLSIDPALAQEIANDPDQFYVNVHTAAAPDGLARGQLGAFVSPPIHALLLGNLETSAIDPNARGAATLSFATPTRIDFVIAMNTPAIGAITDAHVHVGGAGVDGGILVDLENAPGVVVDAQAGTLSGSVNITHTTCSRILANPVGFYVNAHTNAAPAGVARGQCATGSVEFSAALSGAEETTVVNMNARAGFTIELTSFTAANMILAVQPTLGIDAVSGAHVHLGGLGVDGAILIDLLAAPNINKSTPSFSAEGTVAITPSLYARVLANPGGFYANVHTAGAPNGLARGQLSTAARSFFAQLDGDNELVVADGTAAGTLSLVIDSSRHCSFTLGMTNPPVTDITGLRVHDAAAGAEGPALIDLFSGGNLSYGSSTVSGSAVFTGRTAARLIAAADRFYGNAYTAGAPGGIARAQTVLRADNVPPADLTYTTPVVYLTKTAITPNVPTTTGGAVANYSVTPTLPAGLSLDSLTGILSGTPTTQTPAKDYTVVASNGVGSDSAIVNITVNLSPPAGLKYSSPVTYIVNTAITTNNPTSTGGTITSYAMAPGSLALPAGLNLNGVTGAITGTPQTASGATNYTIRGSNTAGFSDAVVNITVNAALSPPSGLSYQSPKDFPTGYAIPEMSPTVGGGPVATWSISPALPAGLTFDTSNGHITGTPTSEKTQAGYTVTAANGSGNSQFTIQITISLGAPNCTSYSPSSLIEYKNQTSGGASIVCDGGGAVSSYSISPGLPSGMTFDTSTGAIVGKPTVSSSSTQYTVTATNNTGTSTAKITIIVY